MTKPTGIQYIKNNPALDELKLRQWCVEQAARCPTITSYAQTLGGQAFPSPDNDMLARADRILKWVKGA